MSLAFDITITLSKYILLLLNSSIFLLEKLDITQEKNLIKVSSLILSILSYNIEEASFNLLSHILFIAFEIIVFFLEFSS